MCVDKELIEELKKQLEDTKTEQVKIVANTITSIASMYFDNRLKLAEIEVEKLKNEDKAEKSGSLIRLIVALVSIGALLFLVVSNKLTGGAIAILTFLATAGLGARRVGVGHIYKGNRAGK